MQPIKGAELRTVNAAMALARRGASMREARDAMDRMLQAGKASIALSRIEDGSALSLELRDCGIVAIVQRVPSATPKRSARRQEQGYEEMG
ncbi:hypothetical protein ROTAS13_03136 [Roseomonas sp. TAS13]|uniref:hypothetical protein n=1 Tax=Roseomonas sp. TAS13 TaxID=1926319 RepID=UPI0009689283|nr:hypothetical protein [Roseomonas sp. TAS13]GAV35460.1 hypothetical protein ROTAS13_03136 [Roseomonas sp. TAS13]